MKSTIKTFACALVAMTFATAPAVAQAPITRPGKQQPAKPAAQPKQQVRPAVQPKQQAKPAVQPKQQQQPVQQSRASSAANPTRNVLYTLPQGEELSCCEYFSNTKAKIDKFACVTFNPNKKKYTFVLNGSPEVTADWVEVCWIDLDSKDKCIYKYSNGNDNYLMLEGQRFGPYEWLGYWIESTPVFWNGQPNYDLEYGKHTFYFKRMGSYYRHDNDGTIYNCGQNTNLYNETDPTISSQNGKFKAKFSNNNKTVTFGPKKYNLASGINANRWDLDNCYVTDNGVCIIRASYSDDGWHYLNFVIGNDIVQLKENEIYDPASKRIKTKDEDAQADRQFEGKDIRWNGNKYIPNVNVSLQDKSKRHLFTTKWDYNYVMIDDNRYGKAAPLRAYYDEAANAFCWVALEGQQLVQYVYKL